MTIKAINVRNQFKGSIKEIVLGDVLSEIDVQTASGIVTSVEHPFVIRLPAEDDDNREPVSHV